METENPFNERVSPSQALQLVSMANFWNMLPELLMDMLIENPLTLQLDSLLTRFSAQAQEASTWFDVDGPITVSLYYKLVFMMRDNVQPLVVELDNVAQELGHDILVPYREDGEILTIKLSEWIPQRLIANA